MHTFTRRHLLVLTLALALLLVVACSTELADPPTEPTAPALAPTSSATPTGQPVAERPTRTPRRPAGRFRSATPDPAGLTATVQSVEQIDFFACGSLDIPDHTPTPTQAPTSTAICNGCDWPGEEFPDRTHVTWFVGLGTGTDLPQVEQEMEVVNAYNEANQDDIYIDLNVIPNAEAYNVLSTQLAHGTPPTIIGPVGVRGISFAREHLLPLDDLIARYQVDLTQYDPRVLDLYRNAQGQLIALPYALFPSFIYYNRDLFDAAGLPYPPQRFGELYQGKTWDMDALRALGMRLTLDASGKNATEPGFDPTKIVQFGFVPQWNDSAISEGAFFGAGDLTGPGGEPTLPAAWKEAWRWFYRARHVDHFVPDAAYANGDAFGQGNVWSSGKAAMAWTHLWYTCCFTAEQVPRWDLAVVPSYDGTYTAKVHADTFAIMRDTPDPDAAFKAYLFLLKSPELRQLYGGLPPDPAGKAEYFKTLGQKFAPNHITWQVALDSLAHPDVPSHEEYLLNDLAIHDRYAAFDTLRHKDPALNLEAEIATLEQDLQLVFATAALMVPASRHAEYGAIKNYGGWLLGNALEGRGAVESVAVAPNGQLTACAAGDRMSRLRQVNNGAVSSILSGYEEAATVQAFSPNGQLFALGTWNGAIWLWDLDNGQERRLLAPASSRTQALVFSPDSNLLAAGSVGKLITILSVSDGNTLQTLQEASPVRALAWSPDGQQLLSVSEEHVRLWDPLSGRLIRTLSSNNTSFVLCCVAYTPDGKRLIVGGRPNSFGALGSLWLWDLAQNKAAYAIQAGELAAVAVSPDGELFATGARAETGQGLFAIRLWRTSDGELLGEQHHHRSPVVGLAFAPDGGQLTALSTDGSVSVWRLTR